MQVLQVGELASLIRAALEEDPELQDVYVEAEIGDCSRSSAGHWYLTLKDARVGQTDRFSVQAVMFRGQSRGLQFQPSSGQQVIAHGKVSTYAPKGSLQLYLDHLEPKGVGALALAFQQLVARLEAEGLFAAERKRPLPFMPRRIAVVTSRQGAAVRDVIHVAQRRCPITEIVVVPTLVQGEGAVLEIVEALRLAGRADVDMVLLVRGGGSMEDLQAFNSEAVARAVAACLHPVVTGVGHETDTTVVDFVADRRAPTPSAAAELSVPSLLQLQSDLDQRGAQLRRRGSGRLELERRALDLLARRIERMAPSTRLATGRIDLDRRSRGMEAAVVRRLRSERQGLLHAEGILLSRGPATRLPRAREEFSGRVGRLEALSPLAVLGRGYSITLLADQPVIIRDSHEVTVGAHVETRLHRGMLRSQVMEVRHQEEAQADGG